METLMLFPTKRHLLISCYCPTRDHAGGLRLLDIYSKLRQFDPKAKFDIFTQKEIVSDCQYDSVDSLFDNIYDTKGMPFNFETFCSLIHDAPSYDIVDLQDYIDSASLARFRHISKKLIFTPMESRCRNYALHGAHLDAAARDEAAELAKQEERICRTVDEVICVSQPDAEFLREHLCLPYVSAIETGVSEIEFGDIERVKSLQRAYAPREPAVHVIVPSYNHARYITRRIESIVQQTYLNIDITVIDDCSPDNSDAVLQALQKKHDFKYIRREKNSGSPFSAWQYAAENFSDGLIWVCESDDFAEPDFVARGVDAFVSNRNLVLYYSNSWVVDEEGNRVGSTLTYFRDQWRAERWLRPFISDGMTELANFQINGMTVPNMSSALMSRDAFAWAFRPRIKRFKLAGDWLFIGELMRKGDVAFSPDHLNNFRRHQETARANTSSARSQAEYLLTKFRLHLRTKKPPRLIAVTLWCDLIGFLHGDCSALDVLKQMLAVSWTDTVRLLLALGPSLFVHPDIRQDLKRKHKEIRLRNAAST